MRAHRDSPGVAAVLANSVATEGSAAPGSEAALAARWAAGVRGPLRLLDGRRLQVVFPGVPGGASGPDFRGAILDAGGDLLRGDVELHLRTSGWRAHGHQRDPAYAAVVLHVVGEDDAGAATTWHESGRAIPVLVLPPVRGAPFPAQFTPPCALNVARGLDPVPILERVSLRRLRMKASEAASLAASGGPGQALYTLLLRQLAGSANRAAFASIARWLPLAVLLERAAERASGVSHERAIAAELRGAAAHLVLRRAGSRPMASPARRLETAAACIAAWFPAGAAPDAWPDLLAPGSALPPKVAGMARGTALEVTINAILPVALATGAWPDGAAEAAWLELRSPGVYGKLRPLEGWLTGESRPFTTAARLQGGLLLHSDYCTRGMCGRCVLSSE